MKLPRFERQNEKWRADRLTGTFLSSQVRSSSSSRTVARCQCQISTVPFGQVICTEIVQDP